MEGHLLTNKAANYPRPIKKYEHSNLHLLTWDCTLPHLPVLAVPLKKVKNNNLWKCAKNNGSKISVNESGMRVGFFMVCVYF